MSNIGWAPSREMRARVAAARLLWEWSGGNRNTKIPAYDLVVEYLGYKDLTDMYDHFNEDDTRKLQLLAGPYGYAIYRMHKVRADASL